MKKTVFILIPVYNDFTSLEILIKKLQELSANYSNARFSLIIVDDGSTNTSPNPVSSQFPTTILRLHLNTGHQRAIAIGLAYIHDNFDFDFVLILDADGEDKPEDTIKLLEAASKNEDKIVFAGRASRQDSLKFQFFYLLYKSLFRILTGKKISFGNFMVIPTEKLQKIVYQTEVWNHLSAAIVKSGLAYITIPVDRGVRYEGRSKMNFSSLVLHGFAAIAVFLERVAARLLIFSFSLIIFSLLIIVSITLIKYFTDLAIPGWTSTIFSSMLIILLQGFLFSLFTVLLFISSHSQRKYIPALYYKDYIASTELLR